MLKLSILHKLSLIQFVLITVPLYFLGYAEEALVSFTMICLYVLIDMNLDLLIRIAKAFKWSRIALIITGFFGVKNILFLFCLLFFWKANVLYHSIGVAFIIMINYLVNSWVLGKKLLTMPYEEE